VPGNSVTLPFHFCHLHLQVQMHLPAEYQKSSFLQPGNYRMSCDNRDDRA